MIDKTRIMILCKVVDNFGDVGVAYRLACTLTDARPGLHITFVVSNLARFKAIAEQSEQIDEKKPSQLYAYKQSVWHILDWNLPESETNRCSVPHILLECFQCGRPEWLDSILFDEQFTTEVHILNIDYLTAEDYAEEFHLLRSGTRKTCIKKIFFMPGFTRKTGGLILGTTNGTITADGKNIPNKISKNGTEQQDGTAKNNFSILFFAYERDCLPLVHEIQDFQNETRKARPGFSVTVFAAAGKSQKPFEDAWLSAGKPFELKQLPFLTQHEFDAFLGRMDFAFVRGEDSLARACLFGIPFVWHAYVQDENYQLVKVRALLARMKRQFSAENMDVIAPLWEWYNGSEKTEFQTGMLRTILSRTLTGTITAQANDFAADLRQNGCLVEHLLSYIDTL